MKEPEAKKKKLSKDDSSSGSEDEEAGVKHMMSNGVTKSSLCVHLHGFFFKSQKNKGRKKQQNSEMDKDARRRKADEMRE